MPIDDARAREGMTHLQAAALEMIEAARAFLDVAEQVVQDPEIVTEIVEVASGLAGQAASRVRRSPSSPAAPESRDDEWPDERPSRLQRIRIS